MKVRKLRPRSISGLAVRTASPMMYGRMRRAFAPDGTAHWIISPNTSGLMSRPASMLSDARPWVVSYVSPEIGRCGKKHCTITAWVYPTSAMARASSTSPGVTGVPGSSGSGPAASTSSWRTWLGQRCIARVSAAWVTVEPSVALRSDTNRAPGVSCVSSARAFSASVANSRAAWGELSQ